jgi:anhydro-N-acetylmuramic acid kinase
LFNTGYLERAKAQAGIDRMSHEDVMATLNRFSADTIVEAIKRCSAHLENVTVYTSGGGMHNGLLMQNIREQLPGYLFKTTDSLTVNPDAKEAVLFAVLANECVAGGVTQIGSGNTDIPFVSMGKISFPQ